MVRFGRWGTARKMPVVKNPARWARAWTAVTRNDWMQDMDSEWEP